MKKYILIISLMIISSSNHAQEFINYTKTNKVNVICIESNTVWIGTDGGIIEMNTNGKINKVYTTADGLVDNHVRAIGIDGQGNKWFGTEYGGVSKYDGKNWVTKRLKGFGSIDVNAISIEENTIWIGTNGGVVEMNTNGNINNVYTTKDGLVDNHVLAIAIDEQGNKWFGTKYGGVSKFNGLGWVTYNLNSRTIVTMKELLRRALHRDPSAIWLSRQPATLGLAPQNIQ